MTSFLRFLVLALTPLLAVSVSFGPAVLYGLVATFVLVAVAALVHATRPHLPEVGQIWAVLGLGVVLITVVDLLVGLWLPEVRALWGLYLNMLAFSPVIVLLPLERPRSSDLAAELVLALKTGVLLTLIFGTTAFVREALGLGTLTLVPASAVWVIPGLHQYPLTILETGAGGFFLMAAAVVLYRSLRPSLLKIAAVSDLFLPQGPSPFPEEAAAAVEPEAFALPESTDDWGEDLAGAVASLATTGSGKRRILVIGSGNGELTYYLSMLCLEHAKTTAFDFRIRGVDHFSARVDTAVKGVYRDHQLDFIPASVRDAWMTRGQGEDRQWRVNNEPRLHVQFEVADFQKGPLFFPQPCHLIVLNQSIEYVSDEKKVQLLATVCDNILTGGALVVLGSFRREFLPEGMKRTGTTVFRKV